MPTYAYACKDCGSAFDIQQSFTDDTLTICPACSGALRKKFNSVGVVFKGSGFYRTDSRDAKNSVPAAPVKTDAGASSAGSTPSGASTASAPSTGASSAGSSAGTGSPAA